ncbi:hypothetical protein [Aquimonas sp.]|jgi:DNA-directed RNA polymerase sigma subunit (sigma70/sigma32)
MKLMLELRAKDHSLRDIGKQVNLSYERVRVLLAREKSNQPATEQGGEAE